METKYIFLHLIIVQIESIRKIFCNNNKNNKIFIMMYAVNTMVLLFTWE